MELADQPAIPSGVGERGGERAEVGDAALAVLAEPARGRTASGEETGATGHAERALAEGVLEEHTGLRQGVEVRCVECCRRPGPRKARKRGALPGAGAADGG